jgi:hypothetical protein
MAIPSSVWFPDIVWCLWCLAPSAAKIALAARGSPRAAGLVDCAEYELLELVAVDLNGLLD